MQLKSSCSYSSGNFYQLIRGRPKENRHLHKRTPSVFTFPRILLEMRDLRVLSPPWAWTVHYYPWSVPLMFSLQQKQYFLLSQEYWLSSFWNYFKFSSHNSRDTVSWPPLSTVKISFNMLTWFIVSWKWCFWIITVNLYLSTRTK